MAPARLEVVTEEPAPEAVELELHEERLERLRIRIADRQFAEIDLDGSDSPRPHWAPWP